MKKLMALIAVVSMVAVSSVAYAATFNVGATVEGANIFTPCTGPLTIQATTIATTNNFEQDELGDGDTCNVVLYANDGTQQDVQMIGTDDGLYNTVESYSWTRLPSASNALSAGTEAWGFQVQNAGVYSVGTNDDGTFTNPDGLTGYDSGFHTVEPTTGTVDTIIEGAPVTTSGSNFDIFFNAATDLDTLAGSYSETITITEVFA